MEAGASKAVPPIAPGKPVRIAGSAGIAVCTLAIFAALVLHDTEVGLGLAICSAGAFGAAALGSSALDSRWRSLLLLGAAALALTPVLRDAEWLITLNLAWALVFGGIALAGSASWRGLGRVASGLGLGLFAGPIEALRAAAKRAPAASSGNVEGLVRGGVISIVLLIVFGALFASADRAFADLLEWFSPDVDSLALEERILIGVAFLSLGGALAYLAAVSEGEPEEAEADPDDPFAPTRTTVGVTEWGMVLGSLVALFSAFVAVQFVVLFGGSEHVIETDGLTYAEYAREGFFQLLAAAALVLAVVAGALRWSKVEGAAQERLLRGLLTALCALTVVILVSAAYRLDLYMDTFGATRERVVAFAVCVWIGATLVIAVGSLFTRRREWVPRTICLTSVALALGLTLMNPDGWVARRNVDRQAATQRFDEAYNAGLSADAVPALAGLPVTLRNDALSTQVDRLEEADGIWGANLGRSEARAAINEAGLQASSDPSSSSSERFISGPPP